MGSLNSTSLFVGALLGLVALTLAPIALLVIAVLTFTFLVLGVIRLGRRPPPVPMTPAQARRFIITSDSQKVVDEFLKELDL